MASSRRLLIAIGVTIWVVSVGLGIRELHSYSTTPGESGAAPAHWPTASSLPHAEGHPHLVLFAHPECPCTRATLGELAEIASSHSVAISIVLAGPGDAWSDATRVLGAQRILDPLELEAQRFGARTSGHVVVYDASGELRYAGGITGSRGHAGINAGRLTVERILAGSDERELDHAVFGCAL